MPGDRVVAAIQNNEVGNATLKLIQCTNFCNFFEFSIAKHFNERAHFAMLEKDLFYLMVF